METTKLNVMGMSCGACAAHVEKALRGVPGVVAARVELQEGRAEVEHQGAAIETLTAAVAKAGYEATPR